MRSWLRDHGLLVVNLALFVVFIVGMILTGVRVYNASRPSTAARSCPCSVTWGPASSWR